MSFAKQKLHKTCYHSDLAIFKLFLNRITLIVTRQKQNTTLTLSGFKIPGLSETRTNLLIPLPFSLKSLFHHESFFVGNKNQSSYRFSEYQF